MYVYWVTFKNNNNNNNNDDNNNNNNNVQALLTFLMDQWHGIGIWLEVHPKPISHIWINYTIWPWVKSLAPSEHQNRW